MHRGRSFYSTLRLACVRAGIWSETLRSAQARLSPPPGKKLQGRGPCRSAHASADAVPRAKALLAPHVGHRIGTAHLPFPFLCLTLHGPSVLALLALLAPRIAPRVGIQTNIDSPALPTVFALQSSQIQEIAVLPFPPSPPSLCPLELHSLTNALSAAASVDYLRRLSSGDLRCDHDQNQGNKLPPCHSAATSRVSLLARTPDPSSRRTGPAISSFGGFETRIVLCNL